MTTSDLITFFEQPDGSGFGLAFDYSCGGGGCGSCTLGHGYWQGDGYAVSMDELTEGDGYGHGDLGDQDHKGCGTCGIIFTMLDTRPINV